MSKQEKIEKAKVSKIEKSIEENDKLLSIMSKSKDEMMDLLEEIEKELDDLESKEYNIEMENENLSWELIEMGNL